MVSHEDLFYKAKEMHRQGDLDKAFALYRSLNDEYPSEPLFFNLLAQVQLERKNISSAIDWLNKSLDLEPSQHETLINLGIAFSEVNNFKKAIDAFTAANKYHKKNPFILFNLAVAYKSNKSFKEALVSFNQAIQIKPDYVEAHNNKGVTLLELKMPTEALVSFNQAIQIKPDYVEAHNNKGVTLLELKMPTEALVSLNQAIQIKTDYAEAYNNKGLALLELKMPTEALVSLNQAIQIKPDYAEAHIIIGETFLSLNLPTEAFKNFERVIQIKPYLFGDWFYLRLANCEWQYLEKLKEFLIEKIKKGIGVIQPLASLYFIEEPQLLKMVAEKFSQERYPENFSLQKNIFHKNHRKIRIGYISADFREHAVSYLTAELYEHHNRIKFEIFAFSLSEKNNDKMQNKIKKSCDEFINCSDFSDEDLALFIRKKEIDIAIDLGGYTKGNRPNLFALRVAPIQISFLGFLGTSGANYMDYLIADSIIIPAKDDIFYTEKILYIPSYQPNDKKKFEIKSKISRKKYSLKDNSIIFCCLNNNVKINPTIFNCWIKILSLTEHSYLKILCSNKNVRENLKKEAVSMGLDSDRFIFMDKKPRELYLEELGLADIFLDTFPYGAGTVASDALCMGVPVITMIGNSFPSRVCSSILHSADLEEFIATSPDDYIRLAINLAKDINKLKSIKDRINNEVKNSNLYDMSKYTSTFESRLEEIYYDHFYR